MQGVKVLESEIRAGSDEISLDLENISTGDGTYLIILRSGTHIVSERLTIIN